MSNEHADAVATKVFDALTGWIERRLAPIAGQLERVALRVGAIEKKNYRQTKGDPGPRGPKGDQGDVPRHRWDGTKLQFTQGPTGERWGESVDLQGPRGRDGGLTAMGLPIGGGGGGTTTSGFGYFPGGWR